MVGINSGELDGNGIGEPGGDGTGEVVVGRDAPHIVVIMAGEWKGVGGNNVFEVCLSMWDRGLIWVRGGKCR